MKKPMKKQVKSKSSKKPNSRKAPVKKAPPQKRHAGMSQDDLVDLIRRTFRMAKRIRLTEDRTERKALYPKAVRLLDKIDDNTKKGDSPKLDKAYNRVYDLLPKTLLDS